MLEFLFGAIDSLLAFAPLWARLCIWAVLFGAGTMLAYARFSDQERIGRIKERVEEARDKLQSYDGTDFDVVASRTTRALRLSFKQLRVMLGPTVAAGLPILAAMIWMEGAYTYQLPDPGAEVEVYTNAAADADGLQRDWEPDSAVVGSSDVTATLRWPGPDDDPVRLVDTSSGRTLLELPIDEPRTVISQKSWTHWLYANPVGYLPDDGPVASVRLDLPHREVLPFGPSWLRTWHLFFMTVLSVAALGVKVAFGID